MGGILNRVVKVKVIWNMGMYMVFCTCSYKSFTNGIIVSDFVTFTDSSPLLYSFTVNKFLLYNFTSIFTSLRLW